MRDVGFLGEPPKPLKPGRMHKMVQGYHWLQIMPASSEEELERQQLGLQEW